MALVAFLVFLFFFSTIAQSRKYATELALLVAQASHKGVVKHGNMTCKPVPAASRIPKLGSNPCHLLSCLWHQSRRLLRHIAKTLSTGQLFLTVLAGITSLQSVPPNNTNSTGLPLPCLHDSTLRCRQMIEPFFIAMFFFPVEYI